VLSNRIGAKKFNLQKTEIVNGQKFVKKFTKTYMCVFIYYEENGKRKQYYKTTGITKSDYDNRGKKGEAEKKRKEIVEEFQKTLDAKKGKRYDNANITVLQMCREYIEHKWREREWSELVYIMSENYLNKMTRFLKTKFNVEDMKLSDFDNDLLRQFYDFEKNTSKGRDGKTPITGNTLKHIRCFFHPAFKWAHYDKKWIGTNITDGIKAPRVIKKEANFLTKEDYYKFWAVLDSHELGDLYKLDLLYGARRSELLFWQFKNLDFEHEIIHIRGKLIYYCERWLEDTTLKSEKSLRALPFLPGVKDILLKIKAKIEQNKKDHRKRYNHKWDGFVMVDELGELYKPDRLSRNVGMLCDKAGIKRVTMHQLRHSSASALLASGASLKMVQEWLGHASIQTTGDVYAHLEMNEKIKAGQRLAEHMNFNKLMGNEKKDMGKLIVDFKEEDSNVKVVQKSS